jgi:hypothetical protein
LEGEESALWATTEVAVKGRRLALGDDGAVGFSFSAWKCSSFNSRIFIVGRFKQPSGWWRTMSTLPLILVLIL